MGISLQNLILMDHDTKLQPLDQCMVKWDSGKQGNKITFLTEQDIDHGSVLTGGMKTNDMGLVIWLNREKAAALLKQKTPAGMNPEHEGPLRSLQMALQEVQRVGGQAALPWGVDLLVPLESLDELFGKLE